MRDHITQSQQDVLDRARRRTTLSIRLGDGSELNVATGAVSFGGKTYLPKLAPVDALNLELTGATEGIKFQISNISLALGHELINTEDILTGLTAVVGCYFYDEQTNTEFHDEKIVGKITVGDIDADFVQITFESLTAASFFNSVLISEAFPDQEIPIAEIPAPIIPQLPVYNDLPAPDVFAGDAPINSRFDTARYHLPQPEMFYSVY